LPNVKTETPLRLFIFVSSVEPVLARFVDSVLPVKAKLIFVAYEVKSIPVNTALPLIKSPLVKLPLP
jgi:hypothetical protein